MDDETRPVEREMIMLDGMVVTIEDSKVGFNGQFWLFRYVSRTGNDQGGIMKWACR